MKKIIAITFAALFTASLSACWTPECSDGCYDRYDHDYCYYDDCYSHWEDPWYDNNCWQDWFTGEWHCGASSCNSAYSDCLDPNPGNNNGGENGNNGNNGENNGSNNGENGNNGENNAPVSCIWSSECSADMTCLNGVCVANSSICVKNADCNDADKMCFEGACVDVECHVNADCADDGICTEGRCLPCEEKLCDTSVEVTCLHSQDCESGICVNGSCLPAGTCAVDANCDVAKGEICDGGICIVPPECRADKDCASGQICNAANECEDDVECHVDADCGNDKMHCFSGMCAECRLNCECPNDGDICMNGACVGLSR